MRSVNRGLSLTQWFGAIALASLVGIAIKTAQAHRYAIQAALEGFTVSPLFFWGCVGLGVVGVLFALALFAVHAVPLKPWKLGRGPRA